MDIPPDQFEVYTQFGITAEVAQVLEMDAGNVAVAYLALFIDADKTTPEQSEAFCSLIKDLIERKGAMYPLSLSVGAVDDLKGGR